MPSDSHPTPPSRLSARDPLDPGPDDRPPTPAHGGSGGTLPLFPGLDLWAGVDERRPEPPHPDPPRTRPSPLGLLSLRDLALWGDRRLLAREVEASRPRRRWVSAVQPKERDPSVQPPEAPGPVATSAVVSHATPAARSGSVHRVPARAISPAADPVADPVANPMPVQAPITAPPPASTPAPADGSGSRRPRAVVRARARAIAQAGRRARARSAAAAAQAAEAQDRRWREKLKSQKTAWRAARAAERQAAADQRAAVAAAAPPALRLTPPRPAGPIARGDPPQDIRSSAEADGSARVTAELAPDPGGGLAEFEPDRPSADGVPAAPAPPVPIAVPKAAPQAAPQPEPKPKPKPKPKSKPNSESESRSKNVQAAASPPPPPPPPTPTPTPTENSTQPPPTHPAQTPGSLPWQPKIDVAPMNRPLSVPPAIAAFRRLRRRLRREAPEPASHDDHRVGNRQEPPWRGPRPKP